MSATQPEMYVRSHVARDLLQTAQLFKTDKLVVWEYVVNGLQYVEPGVNPVVKVALDTRNRTIRVGDNGRGMDWSGLQHFFTMHGENAERKHGRPGRGRFGTGKAAAFGIADVLRITTVRSCGRSKVELRRGDIETMQTGDPIPVRVLEREVPTKQNNGTLVEIEGVHLRTLDQAGVIRYIERHLARWPKNSTVFVNNHESEFVEPPVAWERRFRPEGSAEARLGDVELVIKASKVPLEEDLRGISVYSNGVWYETTLAGSDGRDMSQYIFGDIDVPGLDEDKSPIPPFDMTRSMRLNPSNEFVQALYAFIGRRIEEVRRELVEIERRRKASEDSRKLAQQAAEIARILNEDFDAFRQRIERARAKGGFGSDFTPKAVGYGKTGEALLPDGDIPAEIIDAVTRGKDAARDGPATKSPGQAQIGLERGENHENRGRPADGMGRATKSRGGFQVEFDHLGKESHRAHYDRDKRVIFINLDHPQLAAARNIDLPDDPSFRRLAYEVAFSEYSVALASELAARQEYLDPSDPIVDIRETLNRLARKAANLYV